MWLRYWGKIVDDYSAMRWPCPSGFHVPTYNEVIAFYDTITALWFTNTWESAISLQSCLKLSLPWAISRYSSWGGNPQNVWGAAYVMICCQKSSTTSKMRRTIIVTNTSITSSGDVYVWQWYTFRPVKNTPVIPDSSWITQFDWSSISQGAGIFWNQTLWVISLSSDGTNWITISDKNCWATQVYSSWDPITQANSWYFYQWWNNYWFPLTWPVNKTTTQANAGGYAPSTWNNDVYIYWNTNWSSVDNLDLWWWVTWVQQWPAPIVKRYYWWKMKTSYSAMRWPCPVGFHVPLTSESTTLVTALSDLGMDTSNWADISQYLKIPYAWYRYYTNGDISQQGVAWWYWASDWYSDSNYRLGNCVLFTSTVLYANNNQYRTLGLPVRPFKDTPVIPDSWWTQLYAWTWNSWVFHNSTLWLISISSDWTNWITISDKNLWATTVYNNWDTLSESNCWWYFQRWNNYMFPFTWSITTTYWYVDATNYWPWNYYSDSTFIKSTLSSRDWCYPTNNDLRWRTTWPQQTPVEILKTYYWNTLIWEKP